ncbi:LysM domain-containing protein [Hydrogenophaga sp. PAMC20947]|uniref:LysM peptidoglycan-binding domain-containing protein n=1 Tax=Hydrogenophaga sp. PAMC20947 TaxID=2565558 RepID=UPI00109DDC1E|nr:LysM domain-containing protein [Hydrogenophaga sp. PAMC20947]QCB47805.1 LysM domain-containing protein [Hydrogenophaga sp. PAMC20947]
MPLNTSCTNPSLSRHHLRPLAGAVLLLGALASGSVWAQNYPITKGQRDRATQVAEAGVPLSELASNAPASYKVKRGDTLWAISGLFLKSPWRWPDLWGMNLDDIKNPHRIYPGQELFLDTSNGRARLTTKRPDGAPTEVRVSPRIRSESLSDSAIPAVSMQAIEAFLTEPMIVDEDTFARAPRIVATPENRVLLTAGDRAYARSLYGPNGEGEPLSTAKGQPRQYRVFRNATPLKDPGTGEVLGYEAQYVGGAYIVRDESRRNVEMPPETIGKGDYKPTAQVEAPKTEIVPATIDIVRAKEEMRVGDRLLPEPPREFSNYVPSAPALPIDGRIVSVYGNAVLYAAQNQVVSINRGLEHGVSNGNVFALLRDTNLVTDKTDDSRPKVRLPGERNGLMMVFRTFDKVSYALVLQINDGVKIGDRFVNP